jgi:ring-1,2-phenylacetyl-CoA epoxidase subunit PaaE
MSKFHPLTIANVRNETRDTIAVTFACRRNCRTASNSSRPAPDPARQIGDEDVRRSYSICSAVQDGALRVAIKRTPAACSPAGPTTPCAGQTLDVMPPMGHFNVPLDAANRKHYLAFAAGSGITPILSIIKTTLAAEPHSRFTLFYGNRASSSVIFKEELSDLKDSYLERLKLAYVMSREQQDIELFNGRITKEKAAQFLQHWVRAEDIDVAFICGPEDMMHGVSAALQEAGMPKQNIKIELFAASIPKHTHQPRAAAALPCTSTPKSPSSWTATPPASPWSRTRNRCSTPACALVSTCATRARAAYARPAAAKSSRARSTWTSTTRWKTTKSRAAMC